VGETFPHAPAFTEAQARMGWVKQRQSVMAAWTPCDDSGNGSGVGAEVEAVKRLRAVDPGARGSAGAGLPTASVIGTISESTRGDKHR
jgi:hypothetical protein